MAQPRLIALPAAERAMKVQEIILRAMSGQINWCQAAQILGYSARHLRRLKNNYEEYGYDGLYDRRRKVPSPKKIPAETAQKVLRLYREEYYDFNMRHFHQEIREKHGISLSRSSKEIVV